MNKVVNVMVIIVVINFGPPQTFYFMIEIAARYLNSFIFLVAQLCVFMKIFMTKLFLHWALFLIKSALM